jgi:hypothetical protein
MMNHIDLSHMLRQTLACDLYSNLLTRPTGAAVRSQIEQMLSEGNDRALTVIDFSRVAIIDFSCADEVIAKLLMRYSSDEAPRDAYFLLRGISEDHCDAIEAVLERHDLAAAVEENDGVRIMGTLPDLERRAWDATYALGRAEASEIATRMNASANETESALEALIRRRLVMRVEGGDQYVVVGHHRG